MLKNKIIFQFSALDCLSSILIFNLLIDLPMYYQCLYNRYDTLKQKTFFPVDLLLQIKFM
jgi:hypothetical protein